MRTSSQSSSHSTGRSGVELETDVEHSKVGVTISCTTFKRATQIISCAYWPP